MSAKKKEAAEEAKPKQKRPRRSEQLKLHAEPGDNAKYLEHSLKMWGWGKPDMDKPKAVSDRIEEYFKLCIEDDMKPSVEGLAYAFGVHRKTIWAWASNNGGFRMNEKSRELIRKAYNVLNVQMANYMQNGKINPVAGIFLLKNNMDYEDKKEITVAPVNPLGAETPPEELQQRYVDLIEAESRAESTESEK